MVPTYEVIAEFEDLQVGKRRKQGELVEVDDERAAVLRAVGVIGRRVDAPDTSTSPAVPAASSDLPDADHPNLEPEDLPIKHVGGGWWELPDGRRVKGKEAALAAIAGDER